MSKSRLRSRPSIRNMPITKTGPWQRPSRNSRGMPTLSPLRKHTTSRTRRGSPKNKKKHGRQQSPACANAVPKPSARQCSKARKTRQHRFYADSSSSEDSDGESSSDSDSDVSDCGNTSALLAMTASEAQAKRDLASVRDELTDKVRSGELLSTLLFDTIRMALLNGIQQVNCTSQDAFDKFRQDLKDNDENVLKSLTNPLRNTSHAADGVVEIVKMYCTHQGAPIEEATLNKYITEFKAYIPKL